MAWFPSLPVPASRLQSKHESSMLLVCACLSWKGIYLPGIKTESRNERQGNKQKFPSGSLALAEAGEPGKGSVSPNLSPLLKWPTPSVSITDLFSPREFPTGQDGQRRRERLLATGALRPPSSATASTSPTQQFTPSGFPPPPPKPHQNQRLRDCHHSKGLQRPLLVPGI